MADWTAPFHRPHMPTAEFDELKRKYVAKHGYTISFPGLEDVFHFGTEKPLTDQEKYHWKAKNWNFFDPDRYEEIKYMKRRRKEAYLSMLASPSPKIVNARSAIITSIDDAQDALSTLGAIGTLTYMAATEAAKKVISGPLGWLLAADTALNFVNKVLSPERRMVNLKKTVEKTAKRGPKSGKARVKNATRLLKTGAWRGKVVEALQTSDNVFGVGISLGAIMSLPLDTISGLVRGFKGAEVKLNHPWPDLPHWQRVARRAARNWLAFGAPMEEYITEERHSPVVRVHHVEGISDIIPDSEMSRLQVGLFLAHQTIHSMIDSCDTLDTNLPPTEYELRAPTPTNILTLEVIEEAGDRPEDGSTWPATGETWSRASELMEETSRHLSSNFSSYCTRGAHSLQAWASSRSAIDSSMYAMENVSGVNSLEVENSPSYAAINALQCLNFCTEEEVPASQERIFAEWLQRCDDQNYTPKAREVIDFAERHCGFTFVQMTSGPE